MIWKLTWCKDCEITPGHCINSRVHQWWKGYVGWWEGCVSITLINLFPKFVYIALQWRHNGHDGVSNHQPHYCLLNRLSRRRSKKTPKLRVIGLRAGNSPVTGEFPHKWPVSRKMFPIDDVIMVYQQIRSCSLWRSVAYFVPQDSESSNEIYSH